MEQVSVRGEVAAGLPRGGAAIKKTDEGFVVSISLRPGEVYYLVCAQSPTSVEHAHKLSESGSEMVLIDRINEIRP